MRWRATSVIFGIFAASVSAIGVRANCKVDKRAINIDGDIFEQWVDYGDAATNGRELILAAAPGSCHLISPDEYRVSWKDGTIDVQSAIANTGLHCQMYMRDVRRYRQILLAIDDFEIAKRDAIMQIRLTVPGDMPLLHNKLARVDNLSRVLHLRLEELRKSLREVSI